MPFLQKAAQPDSLRHCTAHSATEDREDVVTTVTMVSEPSAIRVHFRSTGPGPAWAEQQEKKEQMAAAVHHRRVSSSSGGCGGQDARDMFTCWETLIEVAPPRAGLATLVTSPGKGDS